jgi:dTDP-glucose 4,6-dehydratase
VHLLVTGGAGFIGANFIALALSRGYRVTNLDALTYAANLKNCASFENDSNYKFVKGSITNATLLNRIFSASAFDRVINFAAESHVDRSLSAASTFTYTNVVGTVNLLEASMKCGVTQFVQISTDEVYGSLGASGKFEVDSPIRPSSPYSASKAAADHLAMSFHHTHGFDVRITRCTNNFGRFQHPEKFIPTIITRAIAGEEIPVYGDGKYVRDWIYVDDHCEGVMSVIEKGKAGGTYLFGGSREIDNNTLVDTVLDILEERTGKTALRSLIRNVKDRPGHDRRYAINWSESATKLGWEPKAEFATALRQTVDWYLANRNWWGKA